MQNTITGLIIYVALILMPPPITYGLPPCNGSTTGLTERYEPTTQTLHIDDCIDGEILEEDLPIVDMTSSVAVVMTSSGRVTVQLPQLRGELIQDSALVQSSDGPVARETDAGETDTNIDEYGCDKKEIFESNCIMGPE